MARRGGSGGESSGRGFRRSAGRANRAATVSGINLLRMAEAQAAAGRVIAARLRGVAAAAAGSGEDAELALMISEKMQAASDAMAASAPHVALPMLHYAEWMSQCMALWSRSLAVTGDPARAWQRFVEGLALINAAYASAMLATAAEVGSATLAPMHKAVTANDRRLRDR